MEHLSVDDIVMEYEVHGQGEPVLLIHLSVLADGLARPLLARPELASGYQIINYYRRGYMGSSLGSQPLTATLEARDAAALLRHIGVKAAHVVGHSFGGSVALQLAVDATDLVHSLALLEPLMPAAAGAQNRLNALFGPVLEAYRAGDRRRTIELFNNATFGPGWETIIAAAIPGGLEQMVKSVDTFIMGEMKPLQEWQFGPAQAAAIKQPVLSVLGLDTSPFMKAGRSLLHALLPQTEDLDIPATHLLQVKEPEAVARGLAAFFSRHSMTSQLTTYAPQVAKTS